MPDFEQRAAKAKRIAEANDYDVEYDRDDAILPQIVMDDGEYYYEPADVLRYLVIATEPDGPADNSMLFATKAEATSKMGEYARQGWASSLWDLDSESDDPVKERAPR